MSNVVIYARYSSNKQKEESIEGQIRICKDYAEKHDMEVIHEYIDRAETGRSFTSRPDAMRMMKDSKGKAFTAVLVYKFDRFSRDQDDFFRYKKELKKNGVRLISVMEDVGEGAQSTLITGVHTAVNAYYSEELAEKTERGMQENALKGKNNGGYRKYGYDIENGKYVVNEREAKVVRLAFTEYAKGTSNREIIEKLNGLGYKTTMGKPFTHDYLSRMLRNEIYIGVLKWDSIVYEDGVEPIIDKELFEKVQKRLAHNRQTGARARADVQYALIDKVFCGECGQPMVADSGQKRITHSAKNNRQPEGAVAFSIGSTTNIFAAVNSPSSPTEDPEGYKIYRYYTCRGRKNKAYYNGCKKDRVAKDLLERKVVEYASTQYLTDENINRLAKATAKLQAGRPSTKEVAEHQRMIKEEQKKIDNLMDMIEQGMGTKSAFQRVAQAEANIEIEERAISEIMANNAPEMTVDEFKQKLYSIRDKMQAFIKDGVIPDNVIKEFCDIFITAVYVYDNDDGNGGTKVKIIFDELETDGLVGFSEADIELSSIINISASPNEKYPIAVVLKKRYCIGMLLFFHIF